MSQVDTVIEGGYEAAPVIPANVGDWLKTVYSATYQIKCGSVAHLKSLGHGDEFILGYLMAMEAAATVIDAANDAKIVDE